MLFLLFLILIFVIIFAREIKLFIGLFLLYALSLTLWDYWWGKAIVVALFALIILGVIGTIMEKYEKSSFSKWKKEKNKINDDQLREKAYLYGVEHWAKQTGNNSVKEIENYRAWKKDPRTQSHIEEWYQENKNSFN